MVLMHIRAYVPVVPVAEDRDIVEKHIRTLKPKLVKPAVFGNQVF